MIDITEFSRGVRQIVKAIPSGYVLSYGDVAALAGSPAHARLAGRILGAIGFNSEIPCHRVVTAAGRTAPHWPTQTALLRQEGVTFLSSGNVDMRKHRWHPEAEG